MRSIRTKIIIVMVIAILIGMATVGGISIGAIRTLANQDAATAMALLSDNKRRVLNQYMDSIEQSVEMVSNYAQETLDSASLAMGGVIGMDGSGAGLEDRRWDSIAQQAMDSYLRTFTDKVETVFRSVSNHTNSVISYYFRLNPEIARQESGFFYARINSPDFTAMPPVAVLDYPDTDISRVGWYYLPLRRGASSWLDPYYNQNLGVRMISYITPLYKADTFIGVIGMDIAYSTLVSQVEEVEVYESGYAFLMDNSGNILYHPDMESGPTIADSLPELTQAAQRSREEGVATLAQYEYQGVKKMVVCSTLNNGLTLAIAAPLDEVNANWTHLTPRILIDGFLILLVFSAIMSLLLTRITRPLKHLTAASRRLAEGDYNLQLNYKGNDEVGILTGAFQQLVDHLKVYISDLNSKAYKDAMTGVRNKGAFEIFSRMLNDLIPTSGQEQHAFAIVMMDCNELKSVNDHCGHDKGDIYLQNACALICRIFANSPVFRLGGDEFAAILQQEDYQHRDQLLRDFDQQAAEITARATQPWETINISKGMAVYDPAQDDSVDSVLRRADQLMYENKAQMKAGRR